jgi:hypothetical protein
VTSLHKIVDAELDALTREYFVISVTENRRNTFVKYDVLLFGRKTLTL